MFGKMMFAHTKHMDVQHFIKKIEEDLKEAKHNNMHVYMEPVPDISSLKPVQPHAVVKCIPPKVNSPECLLFIFLRVGSTSYTIEISWSQGKHQICLVF
jgi:hypothetical protein